MPLVGSSVKQRVQLVASTTELDTEVQSMTMAKNVLPFPTPNPEAARHTAVQHDRAIFQIGARRFAFQFRTTVTEVNPVDAEILPIRTIRVSPPTGGFGGPADSD